MPGVAQDSFGQLHVRGEHNGLQYRLNGIILPEGISVFGQTLDPATGGIGATDHRRPARRIWQLAPPASSTSRPRAACSTMAARSACMAAAIPPCRRPSPMAARPGTSIISSRATTPPTHWASNPRTAAAIRAMTAPSSITASPFCRTFWTRTAASPPCWAPPTPSSRFPTSVGLQPTGLDGIVGLGPQNPGSGNFVLNANGVTGFPSQTLDERQREITHYGILSYLHSAGSLDYPGLAFGRYSSLFFTPGDNVGDILYNGLAQTAYKRDVAYGVQAEGAWHAFTATPSALACCIRPTTRCRAPPRWCWRRRRAASAAPIPIRSAPIPPRPARPRPCR